MHSTLIAIVFSSADAATEGVRALHELEAKGSLRIASVDLVKRDQDGLVTQECTGSDFPPPSGTLAGLALGSVIGLLGGPAIAAVGAGVGAMVGLVRDIHESAAHTDFIAEVAHALLPGKYAVLAEVEEHETAALDVQMRQLEGVVFRATKGDVIRDHRAHKSAELKADVTASINSLQARLASLQKRSSRTRRPKSKRMWRICGRTTGDARGAGAASERSALRDALLERGGCGPESNAWIRSAGAFLGNSGRKAAGARAQ